MKPTKRTLVHALALTPGIGSKTITRILTRMDLLGQDVSEFIKLGEEALREDYKLRAKPANVWRANVKNLLKEASEQEETLDAHSIQIITATDSHYPRRIESMIPDPPGVLYVHGNTKLLQTETFCVLCSRGADENYLNQIETFAEERILDGQILVTSHDTPEYQRSAVTALRFGSPRMLIFDTGLFNALGNDLKAEPFAAARIWRYEFDKFTDLAITFTPPHKPFFATANKTRDKLVASLSINLDVVNANPKGNMETLAKQAIRAGRNVRVSEHSPHYKNLHSLGAKVVPLKN